MDETLWLEMLRDRNNTAHVYDESSALLLVHDVVDAYIPEFQRVEQGLIARYGDVLTSSDTR